MGRLSQVSRDDAPPAVRAYYDRVFGDRDPVAEPGTASGTRGDWWTTYALAPHVFAHAAQHFAMSGVLTDQPPTTVIDPSFRELGVVRTGWLMESQFVFSQHSKSARRAGLAEAKIAAIRTWETADVYSADEKALLAYTDALVLRRGRVPDGLLAAVQAVLGDGGVLEFSHHVMMYVGYATIARALRLEFDDVDDRIVELPAPEVVDNGTPSEAGGDSQCDTNA